MARLLLVCVLAACEVGSSPRPHGPRPPWSSLDRAARIQAYRDYRLTARPAAFGTVFDRADGAHSYLELGDVVGEYPKSRALYEEARKRDSVIVTLAIGGLSLGVATGIDQLTKNDLSSTGRDGFYAISGVLIGAAVATWLLWGDPSDRLAATYNGELSADLGLGVDISSASAVGSASAGCCVR